MILEENTAVPDFTLPNQHEEATTLSDFRGKQVILYFYPRDNTPGCTKQAIGFTELYEQYQEAGVEIIGVSPDGATSHQNFIEQFSIPYPLLSDPDKKVMAEYGAWGEKMMYGKKVTGTIRSTAWIDADGKLIKHWKRVPKAADHPTKVLEQVRERAAKG